MDSEKPKRIRTVHIAFVQKTMEGATGILVKPITWKIHQGKTYGIEIYHEQKPGNYIQKLDETILENTTPNLQ